MKHIWINGKDGWCVTKEKGKYIVGFGGDECIALLLPYTTKYQAKKLAKKWLKIGVSK